MDQLVQIISPEEIEQRENALDAFFDSAAYTATLLEVLEIEEDDYEIFLDSLIISLGDDYFSVDDYIVLKKYLGDDSFLDTYKLFLKKAKKDMLHNGFSVEDINLLGLDIQTQVRVTLTKCVIYDVVLDPDCIDTEWNIIVQSEDLGNIINSKKNGTVYLINDQGYHECINCIQQANKIAYLFFQTEKGVVVCNYIDRNMFLAPGAFSRVGENNNIHWLITETTDREVLTELDQRDSVAIEKYNDSKDGTEYTRFHGIHGTNPETGGTIIGHWGVEFVVSKEVNNSSDGDDDPKIRKKMYDRIISIPEQEELFHCNGIIKGVYLTSFDIFVVYSEEYYNQDAKGYTSEIVSIYSVDKGDVILEMIGESKHEIIAENDNFIVLEYSHQKDNFYNFKTGVCAGNVKGLKAEKDDHHVLVSYFDEKTGETFYHSTAYTESKLLFEGESSEPTGVEINRVCH